MIHQVRRLLLLAIVLLATACAAAWWWFHDPAHQAQRQLAEAERAIQQRDFAQADERLRALLLQDPEQSRTQFLYAQVSRRLGRTQDAWVALARAVQLGLPPEQAKPEYALLEASDNFSGAEKVLRELAEERAAEMEVLETLARGYARRGRWAEAEQFFTRCVDLDPDELQWLHERGRARMEAGHYHQAAEDFRAITRRSPQHFEARLLLAHCLLSTADMAEAEAELRTCRDLRPARPEPWVGLATCALERGDSDEAQNLVKRALALDPASVLALHLHGDIYLRRQQYDLAVPVFAEVVRLQPRDREGHLKLALALRQQGDAQRARVHELHYERLVQQEKAHPFGVEKSSGRPARFR
jgi:Flp pilus assembly protein TadD